MKLSANTSRRQTLKQLGALTGTIAAPALAMPSLVSGNDETTSAQADPEVAVEAETDPPMERYGIRQYQAPEIVLDHWIDAEGNPTNFSVEAQQGKWLFMKFFQNWCPGCHKLGFPTLQKFVAAFEDNPKVTAVAVQTVFEGFDYNNKDAVRELQLRYKLPIIMGHDQGTEVTNNMPLSMINYRTGGTPWLILVAPNGQVIMNDFHVDSDSLINFVQQNAV